MSQLKRISIVFEETGSDGGKGFQVYVAGSTRDITGIPESERSPAEFWAAKCFALVGQLLVKAGVVKTKHDTSTH